MDAELRASLPASVRGNRFHPQALRIIRETVQEYGHISRKEITRQVCDRLGWVDHRGQRKEMGRRLRCCAFIAKDGSIFRRSAGRIDRPLAGNRCRRDFKCSNEP